MGTKKNTAVQKGQPCRKTKTLKILHSCSHMELPKISMEGKWLEKAGFFVGKQLQVEYQENAICIYPAA